MPEAKDEANQILAETHLVVSEFVLSVDLLRGNVRSVAGPLHLGLARHLHPDLVCLSNLH